MQVRYGRQFKFLKTFGFFEEMPWWSDARDGLKPFSAKSWISLPTKQVRVR